MTYEQSEKRKSLQNILGYDVPEDEIINDLVWALDFYTSACPLKPDVVDRVNRYAMRLSHLRTDPE